MSSGHENGPGVVVVQPSHGEMEMHGEAHDDSKSIKNQEREVSPESECYPIPTEEELTTLRKVAGSLPLVSFALCLVEFAERASYYGAKTVFSNFVQFPLPEGTYLFRIVNLISLLTQLKVAMEQGLLHEAPRKQPVL